MREPASLIDLVEGLEAPDSPLLLGIEGLHGSYAALTDGAVATYIPELGKADPAHFGIAITAVNGQQIAVGDARQPFTIQSCSKPFVYGMALERNGREAVSARIGVEPTGDPFNCIVKLDESGRPHNPLVNAGAIAASSLIPGETFHDRLGLVLETFGRYYGHPVTVDQAVYESERSTGHRNRAMGELMMSTGVLGGNLNDHLDLYFQQCSILTTAVDLSMMGATLAHRGVNPMTQQPALDPQYVRDVLTLMLTCGMYDWAGQWAFEVGIPAKSGVGGGIVAVVPGVMGIGVFSPPLDPQGNSVRGVHVCRTLSRLFNLHLLGETMCRATLSATA